MATGARCRRCFRLGIWQRLFGEGDRRPAGPRAGELRQGKKHGVWVELEHESLVERTYRDGVVHGLERAWHPKGHLVRKTGYVGGKKTGAARRYHANGQLAWEAAYVAGKLHGRVRAWNEDGTSSYEREYRDDHMWNGLDELILERGLVRRGRYEEGRRVGPWESYLADNRIEERGTYVDGKRHGPFELGDDRLDTWHGNFEMDERVGIWALQRADRHRPLTARGEWPRGTQVSWEVTNSTGTVTIEAVTPEDLMRWLEVADRWLSSSFVEGFEGWSAADRERARMWIDAQLARGGERPDPEDESSPREAAARALLVHASGDIALLPHASLPVDDDDAERGYMQRWSPPRAGTVVSIATIQLPRRVIVGAPECLDARRVFTFRPGAYELAAVDTGDRLWMPIVMIRTAGAEITRWRYLGTASDDHYALVPSGAELGALEYPRARVAASGPGQFVVPGSTSDGADCVWIANPTGNGIRAYAGVDAEGIITAVVLQLY